MSKVYEIGAKSVREKVINNLVTLLHNYRTECAAQSTPSQLILPDSLKLMPLYTLSMLKSPALKLMQNTKLDDKVYGLIKFMQHPLNLMPYTFYPRVYKITDIETTVSE